LSGVVSTDASGIITGTVGIDRTIEDGYAAARCCALTQLSVLQKHLESLNVVKSIVAVNGYVNAIPGFADSPKIINGASDLFVAVFGDAGRHVRAAVGVSAWPSTVFPRNLRTRGGIAIFHQGCTLHPATPCSWSASTPAGRKSIRECVWQTSSTSTVA
jgi:enamine deaminase RidA (YjgF/YER057c/UK114 family)